MDYIHFTGGTLLLITSALCFLLWREGDPVLPWKQLGFCALFLGIRRGFSLLSQVYGEGVFEALDLSAMTAALLFLLEAGRRAWAVKPLYLHIPLAALGLSGLCCGSAGLQASIRLAFGLPGALLISAAAFRKASAMSGPACPRRAMRLLGAGTALYAVFSVITPPPSAFLHARWLNEPVVSGFLGLGVGPVSMALLALMGAGIWGYFFTFDTGCSLTGSRKGRLGLTAITVLLAVLLLGGWFTGLLGGTAMTSIRRDLSRDSRLTGKLLSERMARADSAAGTLAALAAVKEYASDGFPSARPGVKQALERCSASQKMEACCLADASGKIRAASAAAAGPNGPPFPGGLLPADPVPGAVYSGFGVASGNRGYYAAAPVISPSGRPSGAAVVRLGLDSFFDDLSAEDRIYLVSPEGVVFLASRPEDVYKWMWRPSSEAAAAVQSSGGFPRLNNVAILGEEPVISAVTDTGRAGLMVSRVPVGPAEWSLVFLHGKDEAALARFFGIAATAALSLLAITFFSFLVLSEAARERAEEMLRMKAEVSELQEIVPICASCKKIRDDKGYWGQVEAYISRHTGAALSHGLCPACAKKLYPKYYSDRDGESGQEKKV